MNPKPISEAHDEDARNATAALKRAAQRARTVAEQTNTAIIIIMRDGKITRVTPDKFKDII
jgi:ABC-type enterochelin transport system substrate-binding protein